MTDVAGELDLGVMRARRSRERLQFYAPSTLTRGVWLLGTGGCALYLYSVALSLGWFWRWPTPLETPFWALPLLLGGVSSVLASGGSQLTLGPDGLELRGFWPQRSRRVFGWEALHTARFFEEETRGRERLYGVRFVFASVRITFRTSEPEVWKALQGRFGG
jgi:hypothetical protein